MMRDPCHIRKLITDPYQVNRAMRDQDQFSRVMRGPIILTRLMRDQSHLNKKMEDPGHSKRQMRYQEERQDSAHFDTMKAGEDVTAWDMRKKYIYLQVEALFPLRDIHLGGFTEKSPTNNQ